MKSFNVPSFYRSPLISKIKLHLKSQDPHRKSKRPFLINTERFSLLIARHFGFCYGVENAIDIAFKALNEAGVIIHADAKAKAIADQLGIKSELATDENFSTEYGVLEMNVAVVDSLDAANDHINKYGTKHTEAIVTESQSNADKFIKQSDCAAVMVNASTRFTDGEEMGMGAEIGISNQKLHARGPMGLEEMTTTTWIVTGSGQIRS